MIQWDYCVVILPGTSATMEPVLKQIGWDGWELVQITFQQGFSGYGSISALVPVGIFKRPMTSQAPPAYR
jgi:hypothetical protein